MESEKPEIKYDEVDFETAIDDFGDETVQFCVKAFLDKTYNELKTLLPTLYKAQNYKEIRGKMHILKTNSGYMGASNFQALCKEFEACCKFESLNVQRVDELYPIFMTNIDKLYKRLKILYNEKFETEIKEEVELENKKDEDEYKNLGSNQVNEKKEENKEEKKEENKEDEINNNNIVIVERKETDNEENKINEESIKIEENKKEHKEKKNSCMSVMNALNQDINKLDENDNSNIIINKNPIKRDFSLQIPKISNIKMNMLNQNVNPVNNDNEKSNVSSENSVNLFETHKPKNFSCKNVLELISLKEGKSHKYYKNQFYKNIFQSFRLTEEESKNKKPPKVQFSPKYTTQSRKNNILNRLRLGFSTMDKSDIRDSLKRYDLSVLKNSATLVKENLSKFLNDEIPKIKVDLNYFLENHDLSKKKEVIEKINIIISNMKYLSDNYNTFFFRMIERLEICKDRKSFKLILEKLIDKLHLLEQELTIIYRVKIKGDNSLLKSLGCYQNENITKNSKKNLPSDMYSNYNPYRNKENNNEQIEGLKKNLGIYSKNKNSKKKLAHFPYSFKVPRLFVIEDKKKIRSSINISSLNKLSSQNTIPSMEYKSKESENINKIDINYKDFKSNENMILDFNNDYPKILETFRKAINDKNKDELIQAIKDFQNNLVNKYLFENLELIIEKWITKIKKSETFGDLNANIEDIEEIIDYMKSELENKNIETNEEESDENEDDYYDEKLKKTKEDAFDKEDDALFNQLKKFNPDAFFLPRNQGFSQHKFKIKVEKLIRETTQNSQEIIQNNNNSNYNFVEKASSHIILSQNFRTKKNKLIGFSYPFKEDTFLNNCKIF